MRSELSDALDAISAVESAFDIMPMSYTDTWVVRGCIVGITNDGKRHWVRFESSELGIQFLDEDMREVAHSFTRSLRRAIAAKPTKAKRALSTSASAAK